MLFFVQFQSVRMQHLRSWIFCEMIQLLPVDIAQKRDDKIVREIGDQQVLWRKFLKESSVARARPNPEKIIFRRIFWRRYIFLRMNGLNLSCPDFCRTI